MPLDPVALFRFVSQNPEVSPTVIIVLLVALTWAGAKRRFKPALFAFVNGAFDLWDLGERRYAGIMRLRQELQSESPRGPQPDTRPSSG